MSALAILGRNSSFCQSEPCSIRTGATSPPPNDAGAPSYAIPSRYANCSVMEAARPPNSSGQCIVHQPFCTSFLEKSRCAASASGSAWNGDSRPISSHPFGSATFSVHSVRAKARASSCSATSSAANRKSIVFTPPVTPWSHCPSLAHRRAFGMATLWRVPARATMLMHTKSAP